MGEWWKLDLAYVDRVEVGNSGLQTNAEGDRLWKKEKKKGGWDELRKGGKV